MTTAINLTDEQTNDVINSMEARQIRLQDLITEARKKKHKKEADELQKLKDRHKATLLEIRRQAGREGVGNGKG